MATYKVLHSAISDAAGNARYRDELVDESDIADVGRLLELGAIVAVDGGNVAADSPIVAGDQVPPAEVSTPAIRKKK